MRTGTSLDGRRKSRLNRDFFCLFLFKYYIGLKIVAVKLGKIVGKMYLNKRFNFVVGREIKTNKTGNVLMT